MSLRVDFDVEKELHDAVRWYESKRASLGLELLAEVDEGIQIILRMPLRFGLLETRLNKQSAVRRYRLHRFPFALILGLMKTKFMFWR